MTRDGAGAELARGALAVRAGPNRAHHPAAPAPFPPAGESDVAAATNPADQYSESRRSTMALAAAQS